MGLGLYLGAPSRTVPSTTSTSSSTSSSSSTSTSTTSTTVYVSPTIPDAVLRDFRATTTTTRAPSPSPDQWRELVSRYFAAADVDKALRVIYCESRGRADVVRQGGTASGLFQHLPRYWSSRSSAAGIPGADILDPEANVLVAAWLFYRDGWRHWPTCGRL